MGIGESQHELRDLDPRAQRVLAPGPGRRRPPALSATRAAQISRAMTVLENLHHDAGVEALLASFGAGMEPPAAGPLGGPARERGKALMPVNGGTFRGCHGSLRGRWGSFRGVLRHRPAGLEAAQACFWSFRTSRKCRSSYLAGFHEILALFRGRCSISSAVPRRGAHVHSAEQRSLECPANTATQADAWRRRLVATTLAVLK
jgi:hypothetical protein